MQIGSGHSSLSLAMLKTLGTDASAGAAGRPEGTVGQAQRGDVKAAGNAARADGAAPPQKAEVAPAAAANEAGVDLGVARTIPRGSFVDLKV